MMEVLSCEQGSPEWFEARRGIPTASEFGQILTPPKSRGGEAKSRRTYMLKLAGEILTGKLTDRVSTKAMDRGHAWEEDARGDYEFSSGEKVERVGFVINRALSVGASPDGTIGAKGGLEIKTAELHIQIDRLLRDELPDEHKPQVQGNMWVTGREWWDFTSYNPELPQFIKRVYRDDGYIANLAGAVAKFNDELQETVEKIRRYGQPSDLMQRLEASARLCGIPQDALMGG